jgi:conjugative transfer signal peptidase TraF
MTGTDFLPRRAISVRIRPVLLAAATAILGVALVGSMGVAGFRWNSTSSAPVGLWRPVSGSSLAIGQHVAACVRSEAPAIQVAIERHYLPSGDCAGGFAPLLKMIAAIPGQRVELSPDGISVDGAAVERAEMLSADSAGRALPHAQLGIYRLAANQYWLLSPENPRSLDSRYFGPVTREEILSAYAPVLTFRSAGESGCACSLSK